MIASHLCGEKQGIDIAKQGILFLFLYIVSKTTRTETGTNLYELIRERIALSTILAIAKCMYILGLCGCGYYTRSNIYHSIIIEWILLDYLHAHM